MHFSRDISDPKKGAIPCSLHPYFTAHLSKLLINDPKLEIVAYHVFIEGDNKS